MELSKLVAKHLCMFRDLLWNQFIRKLHPRSCLAEEIHQLPHTVAELLNTLRTDGAQVQFPMEDWPEPRNYAAVKRGSHPSTRNYLGFLESDMADMIRKGFWTVLPYQAVKHLPGLRLSPMGVVP